MKMLVFITEAFKKNHPFFTIFLSVNFFVEVYNFRTMNNRRSDGYPKKQIYS